MQQKSSMVQRVAEIRDEMLHIEEQATDDAAKKLGITKEWVLEKLVDMVELPGKRKYEAPVAQRALELIGKHFSMFIASDAPNVNVNVGVQFVDHPPAETRQEWEARRRLELAPKANGHANGNGKGHRVTIDYRALLRGLRDNVLIVVIVAVALLIVVIWVL
jgi:hypothetical protein